MIAIKLITIANEGKGSRIEVSITKNELVRVALFRKGLVGLCVTLFLILRILRILHVDTVCALLDLFGLSDFFRMPKVRR